MEPQQADLVVVGAGPGGYAAAFYAADRGRDVLLVEQDARLGGVCLNRGCIPSKALIHATHMIEEAERSAARGVHFGTPRIDLDELRAWKDSIVEKLADGVRSLAKARGVTVTRGRGYFEASGLLRIEGEQGQSYVRYNHAIVATGSSPALPDAFDLGNPRVMTSTQALDIEEIPNDLLVIGGGYIGMELSSVYAKLGSNVVVVEALETILPGADADLRRLVEDKAKREFRDIRVGSRVLSMVTKGSQIQARVASGDDDPVEELYDRVLVSVGRVPNTEDLGLENTEAELDERGFVRVDSGRRTGDPTISAIGDCVGGVMLAHKASKDARVAIETLAGEAATVEDVVIPAVVFTDPELAWAGLTELDAKERGIDVETAKFQWGASGRALTLDRPEGLTKLVIEPGTERVLGVGIVGPGAGDLISEGCLAVEMAATVRDLADVVHPHPTLSETIMESAEVFYGHSSHAIPRKRR
jgi:dihydrolipoamide dehydrogenase